ncbi:hypothetical protein AX16_005771 [Volvariella volvacea WC 439]|nr:hypothetical protein AX16_005771 [Volvariella volvacea WC 439]
MRVSSFFTSLFALVVITQVSATPVAIAVDTRDESASDATELLPRYGNPRLGRF